MESRDEEFEVASAITNFLQPGGRGSKQEEGLRFVVVPIFVIMFLTSGAQAAALLNPALCGSPERT